MTINSLGKDESGEGLETSNVTLEHTATYNDSPLMCSQYDAGCAITAAGRSTSFKFVGGGQGNVARNNTYIQTDATSLNIRPSDAVELMPSSTNLAQTGLVIQNNLIPLGLYGVITADGSTYPTISSVWNAFGGSDMDNQGNVLYSNTDPVRYAQWTTCNAPRICSPNTINTSITSVQGATLVVDAAKAKYELVPGSPYTGAGVDVAKVAAVRGMDIPVTSTTATLTYSVATDLVATQCSLEATTDTNLRDDDGTFALLAQVDPAISPRANYTGETGGGTASRTWPLTGLTSPTTYYYRLTCGGAANRGSFTTTAGPTPVYGSSTRGGTTRGGVLR